MPTYEYACKSCDSHIEVVQAFTDDALTQCASCGGELRKVFGSIGISFKGSGFYKNDSRPSSGSASKSESKTETKVDSGSTDSKSTESTSGEKTKSEAKAPSKSSDVKAS